MKDVISAAQQVKTDEPILLDQILEKLLASESSEEFKQAFPQECKKQEIASFSDEMVLEESK